MQPQREGGTEKLIEFDDPLCVSLLHFEFAGKRAGLLSTINDDQRAMAAWRNRMRLAGGHKVDRAGRHHDHLLGEGQIHLPVQHQQRFVEVMRFGRIGAAVHTQDLEVSAGHLAEHLRAPSLRQGRRRSGKINHRHLNFSLSPKYLG